MRGDLLKSLGSGPSGSWSATYEGKRKQYLSAQRLNKEFTFNYPTEKGAAVDEAVSLNIFRTRKQLTLLDLFQG